MIATGAAVESISTPNNRRAGSRFAMESVYPDGGIVEQVYHNGAAETDMAKPWSMPALDLAQRRRDRGISLAAIAEATKISPYFLQAIEAEEFEKLPGGIFDTSYIRQYARVAGLDERKILAQYRRSMDHPVIDRSRLQPDAGFTLLHILRRFLYGLGKD
jgi:hypothetical protein